MILDKLFELYDLEEEKRYQKEFEELSKIDEQEAMWVNKSPNRYKNGYENFMNLLKEHNFGETSPSGENLEAIKKHNLSNEEAALIYMYTAYFVFEPVNRQLRGTKQDKDTLEYARLLDVSLDNLPSYANKEVYRDIKNPKDVKKLLDEYESKLGDIHEEKAYMSTHIMNNRWSDKENGIHINIKTSLNSFGKDLSELSFNSEETEVLFKRNSRFKVIKVDRENNTVEFEEIEY